VFTGLIADVGRVESAERSADGARLRIATGLAAEISSGDSVSVSGVCLTAATATDGGFEADVSPQTLSLTTLGSLEDGDPVNLELALRASDRLGGHVVQGHVDGTAEVVEAAPEGESRRLRIAVPSELRRYLVERGSVAVDGVSLTVAALNGEAFETALIPETLARTTLAHADAGTRVNLECDLLGKYAIDHHSEERSE